MKSIMMNCKEATRLLSEKKDRPLSGKEKTSLTFHTLICSAISIFAQSYIKGKDKKDSE
jgi:hypothetical protein